MGLPYILGDSDPRDPLKGWDKTWAYLKALGDSTWRMVGLLTRWASIRLLVIKSLERLAS